MEDTDGYVLKDMPVFVCRTGGIQEKTPSAALQKAFL